MKEQNSGEASNRGPVSAHLPDEKPMHGAIVHEVPVPVGEPLVDESGVGKPSTPMVSMGETIAHQTPIGTNVGSSAALLNREESEHFRTRWNEIQRSFVDEPRSAVQQADGLVSEVVESVTQMFANEHSSLESQWNQGDDVSTEDLRKALQRYRSFFNRMVV